MMGDYDVTLLHGVMKDIKYLRMCHYNTALPSHCDFYGNKIANHLAKERSKLSQKDSYTFYNEVTAIIKPKSEAISKVNNPAFNPKLSTTN